MSEDSFRPNPVVDPALPVGLRERIVRDWSPPLVPEGEPVTRRFRIREGCVQVLAVGFPLLLATLLSGRYLGMVIVGISLAAYTVALVCRHDVTPTTRVMGILTGVGAAVVVPLWALGQATISVWSPWLVFGVMVAMVVTDSLTSRVYEPADLVHVVLPEDIDEAHHPLLWEVQYTIDRITEADDELSDDVDIDRALAILRDQEWQIACLLTDRRMSWHAHLFRWQHAVSPRGGEGTKPQRRRPGEVEDAIRARVQQIIEYRVLLDRVWETHRELRLCQEARDAALEYTGPLAAALSLSVGEIDEVAASAKAASRAWDEHARLLIDSPLPSSG